jgi:hypothetical protein
MCSTAGALVAAVDALAQVDPDPLCAAELQELIATVGPQLDRLSGIVSAALGALQARTGGTVPSAPGPDGAPGPNVAVRHWLRDTLACGGPAAGAHVKLALDLRALPRVAAAVKDGTVKAEQARILTRLLGRIGLERLLESQDELIEVASRFDPQGLAAWVRHLIATWCEPQLEHDARTAENKRYLQTRDQGDGTTRGSFVLPTESMESFHTVLEPLARATGQDDPRSAGQRRADALLEVFDLAAKHGDLPETGGLPTHLHYVMPAGWAAQQSPPPFPDLLRASLPGAGTAGTWGTDTGVPVPPAGSCAIGVWSGPQTRARIETILCDARISRVLLSPAGQVTGLESLSDSITNAQRRALIARDRGCIARGCNRPPAFCDAHHLVSREDGGITSLGNLVLLCRRHHLLWHQGRLHLHDLHVPWLASQAESGAGPPDGADG